MLSVKGKLDMPFPLFLQVLLILPLLSGILNLQWIHSRACNLSISYHHLFGATQRIFLFCHFFQIIDFVTPHLFSIVSRCIALPCITKVILLLSLPSVKPSRFSNLEV